MPGASRHTSITVVCKKCHKRLRAPASAAGKRGQCGQCGNVFVIPQAGTRTMPAAKAPPTVADDQEMVTVPVEVVLKSGFISSGIIIALAVLVAVGVVSYMVFFR